MTSSNDSMPQPRQPWYKVPIPVIRDTKGFVLSRAAYPRYRLLGRLSLREFLWFWTVMVLLFASLIVCTINLVHTLRNTDTNRIRIKAMTAEVSNLAAYKIPPPRHTISLKKLHSNFRNKKHYIMDNETNVTAKKYLANRDYCKQIKQNEVNNRTQSCFKEIRSSMLTNEENENSRSLLWSLMRKDQTNKEASLQNTYPRINRSVFYQFFRKLLYHMMAIVV